VKRYKIYGEILSPVHIGTGDELEPFDYVIRDRRLIRFDLLKVLEHLTPEERDRFDRLNDGGSLVELRKYIAEIVDPERDALYTCDVTDQIQRAYDRKLGDIRNQMFIHPFIRSGGVPYIPGSSLKGAIRTAVISETARSDPGKLERLKGKKERKKKSYEDEFQRRGRAPTPHFRFLEGDVLGHQNAKQDPFRALKFSDIALRREDILVSRADNIGWTDRDETHPPRGVSLEVEHTYGSLLDRPITFEGECRVDEDLMRHVGRDGISRPLDLATVLNQCWEFYSRRFDPEEEGRFITDDGVFDHLLRKIENCADGRECVIRLGRFSGAPSMTVDELRWLPPRRIQGRDYRWEEPGKTRFYSEGKYPFGWVKLRFEEVS
jgi:CRISPR-associated protein Csm5